MNTNNRLKNTVPHPRRAPRPEIVVAEDRNFQTNALDTHVSDIPDLPGRTACFKTGNAPALALPFFTVLLLAGTLLFPGCEDEAPTAYIPEQFVEAYLFVDEPIEGIKVTRSQSLEIPFEYQNSTVTDAEVSVSGGGKTYNLSYHLVDGIGSYYYPDTTEIVLPETEYSLRVRYPEGVVLSGTTVTPQRIQWIKQPKPWLQYPTDTINLPSPDSVRISWTTGNTTEFLIRVRCLDTARYGAYLSPPTTELNGRTNNLDFFEDQERPTFYSVVRWGFVQASEVPTVWTAFRWFGKHAVGILAPDENFINWFKMTQFSGRPQYNDQYGSIKGGLGVFGSASIVEQEAFILKK